MSSNFRLLEPSGLGRHEKFLAVETFFFFSRICDICGNGKSAILFVFTTLGGLIKHLVYS